MSNNTTFQMIIDNMVSGVQYDQNIKFSVVDYYNQTMFLNSVNKLTINSVNKTAVLMKVINSSLLRSGVATFNNLIVITKPGSTNMLLQATTSAIDSAKVKEVDGSVSNNLISVNFRFCKPGEIQLSDNTCSTWAPGTFSLDWNSTECQSCSSNANAQWLGGNQISVSAGYWRMSQNTSTIVEWIYDKAWDGGYVDQEDAPVNWATGYTGILWNEWQIANGTKYSKVSDFECSKWPSPVYNAIRVVGLIIIVLMFVFLIIIVNIRKIKESQFSVLLRIFTNYLQLISGMMSFNIKFPTIITNMFLPVNEVGASSDVFLSFDCFVTDFDIKGPFSSNKIFKAFLSGFLPIILLFVFVIIWLWLKLVNWRLVPNFQRNITISFISVVFIFYPRLVQSIFSMFECVTINSGNNRSKINLFDSCYGSKQIKWLLVISLQIFVIWVSSMPAIALYLLYKNRNKSNDNIIKQNFLILNQGLKFWPDGQYYDSTYQIWRNWDGKWTGYWKGQKQWFIWDSGKVLDLETLSCVTNWDASKYQISSSQYSTGELWRLSQFYVDPLSSELIELGTISYPYKSMKAVSSDILNNFSHQKVNITIYLKEYEYVYMSDLTGFYLNITLVQITSYSKFSSS